MKGIDKLPSGKFRVRITHRGKSIYKVVGTEEEAVSLRDAIRDELNSERAVPVEGLSASTWGPTWMRDFRSGNRDFRTERGRFENHIATADWGKKPLGAVESPDIVAWLQVLQRKKAVLNGKTLKRTLGLSTRKNIFNLARSLFSDALSLGIVKTNPCAGVKVKRSSADQNNDRISEDWPLRPAEQKRIAELLEGNPELWIIVFCMGTGLRQGEAWNLHVKDVHLDAPEGPYAHIRFGSKGKSPKNGKTRKVPLFGPALEAAREWLKALPLYAPHNPHGLMFPTPAVEKQKRAGYREYKGGAYRQIGKAPAAWIELRQAFGERKVWWHLLRHTCATSLLCGWWGMKKWSLEEVSKMLGHSGMKVTERYAHLLESELASLAAESHAWWVAARGSNDSGNGSGSGDASAGSVGPSPDGSPDAPASCHADVMTSTAPAEIINDINGAPGRSRICDQRFRNPEKHTVFSGNTALVTSSCQLFQALQDEDEEGAWQAAQELAKSILEDPAVVLAQAILRGGPFAFRRALELVEVLRAGAGSAAGKQRA